MGNHYNHPLRSFESTWIFGGTMKFGIETLSDEEEFGVGPTLTPATRNEESI